MLDEYFMVKGETAAILYDKIAKNAPIYDFHCHLSAREIYEDRVFEDMADLCLEYDHYKWRAMRYAGIPEEYITGCKTGAEKFKKWAWTCQRLIGSPLYHWTNMELKACFEVDEFLKESNAAEIYEACNHKIESETLSPVKMIRKFGVKLICTTDDPADTLEYHKLLGMKKDLGFRVLPTFRPDRALDILSEGFADYMEELSECSGIGIKTYDELICALKERLEYFYKAGCRLSDHSLESISHIEADEKEVNEIFLRRLGRKPVSAAQAGSFRSLTLKILACEYKRKGWVMQLHIGAMRNVNEAMFRKLGNDAGFDIMNDFGIAAPLSGLLNQMNRAEGLPKTILYTLNPKDNPVLSSLPHCFPEEGIRGKVQFGTAWWFNDHKDGIYSQLKSISEQGMLAHFIGMLTDSRNFLSYVRHDYFRRILCSFIGELADSGEVEKDNTILGEIVENICFRNIKNYLGMEEIE